MTNITKNYYVESELKTAYEGFNNLEKRSEVKSIIEDQELSLKYVDVKTRSYWQNDEATMVFMSKKENYKTGLVIGILADLLVVDEFDIAKVAGKTIIRFWWD